MLTKGAIGNLVNRYKAVLKKCNLINTFGSLAVAVSVMGTLASGTAFADSIVTKSDTELVTQVFGGATITSGAHNVDSTGIELKNVTSTKTNLYLVGGPVTKGNTYSNLVVGSAENEANNKYASTVSIHDSQWVGTSDVPFSFVVGAGLMEANGTKTDNNYHAEAKYFGTSVELDNVDATGAYVVGGGKIYNAGRGEMEVTNTYVNITGNTTVYSVIGGSYVSGSKAKSTSLTTDTTNIYIGKDVIVKGMVVKGEYQIGKVVGGHYSNWFGKDVTVNTTNVVIDGADLSEAIVIGGNYFDAGGTASHASESSATKTNITVKDSTVGAIYASDYLDNATANRKFTSTTKEANLIIENSTVKGDVVGGSYTYGANTDADVSQAVSVQLNGVKVEGTITTDNVDVDSEGNKQFVQNSIEDSSMSLTNVEAEAVKASKGALNLRAEGKTGKTSIGTLTAVEGVEVALSADGAANDAAGGDITKAIVIGDGDFSATVDMEEGMYEGAKSGSIENGVATVTEATNSVMANVLDIASSQALSMNRVLMNDVRKRLGDIRAAEGTHGAWMRYDGGSFSGSNGYENDFTTFQIGFDTMPSADAPRFGVAFAYTNSDTDMKRGSAEMDAFSLALYGTKMYDNGMFFDVIGRVATADSDIVVDGDKKGSMDNVALSLSGEFGWRFDVAEKFYIEPQAELTYTYITSDDLSLSGGYNYDFDSVDSVIGRVGVATGFKLPNDLGDVYVRASAVHEFLGDAAVRGGGNVYETDGDDTWLEYGIGANVKLTDSTYIWADVERTEGADIDEEWRGTVGIRYSF